MNEKWIFFNPLISVTRSSSCFITWQQLNIQRHPIIMKSLKYNQALAEKRIHRTCACFRFSFKFPHIQISSDSFIRHMSASESQCRPITFYCKFNEECLWQKNSQNNLGNRGKSQNETAKLVLEFNAEEFYAAPSPTFKSFCGPSYRSTKMFWVLALNRSLFMFSIVLLRFYFSTPLPKHCSTYLATMVYYLVLIFILLTPCVLERSNVPPMERDSGKWFCLFTDSNVMRPVTHGAVFIHVSYSVTYWYKIL